MSKYKFVQPSNPEEDGNPFGLDMSKYEFVQPSNPEEDGKPFGLDTSKYKFVQPSNPEEDEKPFGLDTNKYKFAQCKDQVDEITIEQVSKLTGLAIISIEVRLRRGTFPKPVCRMKRARYWDRKEVLEWMKRYRAQKEKRTCKSYTTLQWSKDREALDRCEFGVPYLALTDNGAYELRRTEPEADTDDVVAWAELPDEEALARQLWMSWIKGDKQ